MGNYRELYHHGTKGMKWGVRRYQNKDGTLTPAGKKRYIREQRMIDKKLKDHRSFGPYQSSVGGEKMELRSSNKNLSNKWDAAAKAGKGTKEWKEWENATDKFNRELDRKFKDKQVNAFINDTRMYQLSEQGRKYLEQNIDKLAYKI